MRTVTSRHKGVCAFCRFGISEGDTIVKVPPQVHQTKGYSTSTRRWAHLKCKLAWPHLPEDDEPVTCPRCNEQGIPFRKLADHMLENWAEDYMVDSAWRKIAYARAEEAGAFEGIPELERAGQS